MLGRDNPGICQEIRDNQKISVLLPSEDYLDQTGLKVLQSVAGTSLICGYKSLHNDKVKLTYDISHYLPLSAMLPKLTIDQLLGVVGDFVGALDQIYDIGFLQYENISLEPDDIFIDSNSYRTVLIYLPLKVQGSGMGRTEFEQYFRASLRRVLAASAFAHAPALQALDHAVEDGVAIAEIQKRLRAGQFSAPPAPLPTPPPAPEPTPTPQKSGPSNLIERLFRRKGDVPPKPKPIPQSAEGAWHLVGLDPADPVDFLIDRPEFIVGRSPQSAQGVISFSRTIGRSHCKFYLENGQCFLQDLASSNGTFLNEVRLAQDRRYPLSPGDRIRLSSSDFVMRRG